MGLIMLKRCLANSISIFVFLAMAGVGRAEIHERVAKIDGKPHYMCESTLEYTASDHENQLLRDAETSFIVVKGTTNITLDDFISSGKLCEFRGHHEWDDSEWNFSSPCGFWTNSNDKNLIKDVWNPGQICTICHHCRKRVTVNKNVEEWEK